MARVFISYSRKDTGFVERLRAALADRERDAWVDWQDIPPTAKWLREVFDGIQAADNFIFVITPDAIASRVCQLEIAHASQMKKRIIPVLLRGVQVASLPECIASRNWISFQSDATFDRSVEQLTLSIDTDFEYLKVHTQLLLKALEWDSCGRDESYVLRGSELRAAEAWLADAMKMEPQPTPLHQEFLAASIDAERESETERRTRHRYLAMRDAALKAYIRPYLEQRKEALAKHQQALAESKFLRFSKDVMDVDEELSGLLNFLDAGGKWHPEEAISVRPLGPQEDYLEVFEFPCCGKSVVADRAPSCFRTDGCKESAISDGSES